MTSSLPARVALSLGHTLAPGDDTARPEVDGVALLLHAGGRVRSDADFIFYNQPRSACGTLVLVETADTAGFSVDLGAAPSDVQAIAFCMSVYQNTLASVSELRATARDPGIGSEVFCFRLAPQAAESAAIVIVRLERESSGWIARESAVPFEDLGAMARAFGAI